MTGRDQRRLARGMRAWTKPVRQAVARIRPGDDEQAPVVEERSAWLVDCAVYAQGHRLPGDVDLRRAPAVAERADGFVWLGVHDPSPADFAQVAEVFGLHELAVEEAVTTSHRPQIEHYGDVALFALRTTRYVEHPQLTETSEVVETGEVLIFLGARFVITVRHGAPGELSSVRADLEQRPDLLGLGPWSVAHAVCDRLVDSYLEVSDGFEADLDALEEDVFARATSDKIAHIYQLKRELMELRRAVAPLQRPLAAIVEDKTLLAKEIRRYFRDVNDHLLRVVERIASYDDLLNSLLQARLAQVSVAQNSDMRKIAAWAAIAAMQTAIAGIYGMNFDFMPELRWRYGYAGVLLVMIVAGYSLYRAFRRSGWL
jgi:magnesium transporter